MSNETSRFNPGLNVIDLDQRRRNDFKVHAYEMDKFTMTWENLGLSCEGTLQIEQALEYYDAT
ncbi:MAG TPA: hypothetical protein DCY51_04445 [Bacteroidetes bacterium]|jgi:hypothetical protein|nr:hypothetical protein [Bacteroidota bacterium]|tara:strand:- start:236 stop:424 length:189 start_codon:yes stop_codon:yes gene_type:complete